MTGAISLNIRAGSENNIGWFCNLHHFARYKNIVTYSNTKIISVDNLTWLYYKWEFNY